MTARSGSDRRRPSTAKAGNGVVTRRSPYSFSETMSRLERAARAAGVESVGRIDYRADAKRHGFALEPAELLMFNRVEPCTCLIRLRRTVGLDLPLKVLVWIEDQSVWIAYNDLGYFALRHAATDRRTSSSERDWLNALIEAAMAPA